MPGPGAAAPIGSATAAHQQLARKQRELYVGNLAVGLVTAQMLKDLFSAPLNTLESQSGAVVAPPVADTRLDSSGKFAFVDEHARGCRTQHSPTQ